mmetsp:Transcript_2679/g.8985  ORF Transcript_2679/g.8985 Transcript_2679/m.8985 type:complete len:272 (-) Transcript_2679:560-1375(-)
MTHQAKVMSPWFCKVSTNRRRVSCFEARGGSTTRGRTTAATASAVPAPNRLRTVPNSCFTRGTSLPSSLARTPVSQKRMAFVARKDTAKLAASISASSVYSSASSSRASSTPSRASVRLRTARAPTKRPVMRSCIANTTTTHKKEFVLNTGRYCTRPPTQMAAKPVMCARSIAQHRSAFSRSSRKSLPLRTKTSMPLIRATLFLPRGCRTLSSSTTSPRSSRMGSATTQNSLLRSTGWASKLAPETTAMQKFSAMNHIRSRATLMKRWIHS